VAATATGLQWAGLAYNVSRPADFRGYHRTMLQVAESAHGATQTGQLTAQQQLDGRVTAAFVRAGFNDATKASAAGLPVRIHPPPLVAETAALGRGGGLGVR